MALQKLLSKQNRCEYTERPEVREVCQTVQMRAFAEECKQVPKLIPKVDCTREMKPIPLEEICVKVDIQLPREECKWEKRTDCRYIMPFPGNVSGACYSRLYFPVQHWRGF